MSKTEKRTPPGRGSTTVRIKDMQQKRLRAAMLTIWLVTVLFICMGYYYVTGVEYLGDGGVRAVFSQVSGHLAFSFAGRGILPSVSYTMSAHGIPSDTLDATAAFYCLIGGMLMLSIVGSLIAALSGAFARAQIQRELAPIYQLAKNAVRLSNESDPRKSPGAGNSSESIHKLEDAIERIKPDSPDSKLHTRDADMKGLEDAINSLLERTRDSYSQQIRFVSDASHELRTPIAVIKGYTDMLDRWGKEDEAVLEESIAAIKTETEHMNRLVEQLLFLARGDSGRTQLSIESFSLTAIVREVYNEYKMIDADHEWILQGNGDVTAKGDVALLKQAIRILSDNAAKYTPAGKAVSLKAAVDDGGAPEIIVQDGGVGMAQEDVSRVFDRFYRADPARSGGQSGTGLGLSIAKWIVDRHGGYFDVLSLEDVGTRFTIHLPKAE